MNAPKRSRGLTLIELTSTLAAATLVLTLGVPAFRGLQSDIRGTSVRTALTASFALARSEAIRRGVPVSVCPSADGATCASGSASDWATGWIVSTPANADQEVLDRVRFDQARFTLGVDDAIARGVTFQASGSPGANGLFSYRDEGTHWGLRLIPIGRLEPLADSPPRP